MAKGDDIEERLVTFAVKVIELTDRLPDSRAGNHLAGQLVRCGTSPAAHYAEARGAESPRDFLHKLKLCSKELNESRVWLRIIGKSKLLPREGVIETFRECDELCRTLNAIAFQITILYGLAQDQPCQRGRTQGSPQPAKMFF